MPNKSRGKSDEAKRKEIANCLAYEVTPEMARTIKKGNLGAYMPILLNWYTTLECLDPEDFKRFILDSMKYHSDGTLPEYKKGSTLFMVWTMAKGTYDNLLKNYAKQCESNWKTKTATDIFHEMQNGLSQQEIMERHPEYRPISTNGNDSSQVVTTRHHIGEETGKEKEKGKEPEPVSAMGETTTTAATPEATTPPKSSHPEKSAPNEILDDGLKKKIKMKLGEGESDEEAFEKARSYIRSSRKPETIEQAVELVPDNSQRQESFLHAFEKIAFMLLNPQ